MIKVTIETIGELPHLRLLSCVHVKLCTCNTYFDVDTILINVYRQIMCENINYKSKAQVKNHPIPHIAYFVP